MAVTWEAPGNSLAEYPIINTAPSETVEIAEGAGYLEDAVRIACTTTNSNEIGVRGQDPSGDANVLQFRFCIEPGGAFVSGAVHNLVHIWTSTLAQPGNPYADDLLELRLVSTDNEHFKLRLFDLFGNVASTGSTVLEVGRWYKVVIFTGDGTNKLYLDDNDSWEISQTTDSYTKIGAFAIGKFYSQVFAGAILLDTTHTWFATTITPSTIAGKNNTAIDGWFQRYRVPGKPGQAAIVRNYNEGLNGSYEPAPDVVSESNAYGMHLALKVNSQTYFDELEQFCYYVLERRNQPGSLPAPALMCWHYDNIGGVPFDVNFATDGDLDRLECLWEAHSKWGSDGTINYRARARLIERDLKAYGFKKIDGRLYLIDNYYSKQNDPGDVNLSYLSFTAFRRARQETSDQEWDQAVVGGYKMLGERQHATSGLFPNWSQIADTGTTTGPAGYRDDNFTYDAIRVLWRLARDWFFEQDKRAYDLLTGNLLTFLQGQYTTYGNIKAEYLLNGTIKENYTTTLMTAIYSLVFFASNPAHATGTALYSSVTTSFQRHPSGSYWGSASYYGGALVPMVVALKELLDKNEGYFTRTHSQAFVQ